MKQLYIILLACLLVGCQEEQLMDNSLITVSIQGNQLEGMTRNNEGKNIFTAGDNASLFSQGGINANNIALTYQDGEWHPETPLYWDKSGMMHRLSSTIRHSHQPNKNFTIRKEI